MVDPIDMSPARQKMAAYYGQLFFVARMQSILTSAEVVRCRKTLEEDLQVISTVSCERQPLEQAILRLSPDHVILIRIVVGNPEDEKADAIVVPTGRATGNHVYPIELPSLYGICKNSKSLKNTGRELVKQQLFNVPVTKKLLSFRHYFHLVCNVLAAFSTIKLFSMSLHVL